MRILPMSPPPCTARYATAHGPGGVSVTSEEKVKQAYPGATLRSYRAKYGYVTYFHVHETGDERSAVIGSAANFRRSAWADAARRIKEGRGERG